MRKIDLKVEGMTCELCAMTIKRALLEIGAKGKVDLANATVTVEYDENNLSLEKMKEEIEEYGYKVISTLY